MPLTRRRRAITPRLPAHADARVTAVAHELAGCVRISGDVRSLARLVTDIVLRPRASRAPGSGWAVGIVAGLWDDRERRVRLRGNLELVYRLNRGDVLALRETWIDDCYRLPFEDRLRTVLDLGANIGLTSVWLAHTYGSDMVVAVEPLAANVRLLRRNLARNGINARVVQAAVGPADGTAWFLPAVNSTEGYVAHGVGAGDDGVRVPMVTLDRLLGELGPGVVVDLLKLDIEGGERALLLRGDRRWLGRVRAILAEFHPWMVNCGGLVEVIEREGFRHVPAVNSGVGSVDAFVREETM